MDTRRHSELQSCSYLDGNCQSLRDPGNAGRTEAGVWDAPESVLYTSICIEKYPTCCLCSRDAVSGKFFSWEWRGPKMLRPSDISPGFVENTVISPGFLIAAFFSNLQGVCSRRRVGEPFLACLKFLVRSPSLHLKRKRRGGDFFFFCIVSETTKLQ